MGIYYDICVGACLTNITAYAGNMSVTVRVTRDMNYFPVSLSFVPVTESDAYEPTAHKKYKLKQIWNWITNLRGPPRDNF